MVKIIGKTNCTRCELIKSKLKDEDVDFEYEYIEDLNSSQQSKIKKDSIKNKMLSFPICFVEDEMVTMEYILKNIDDL